MGNYALIKFKKRSGKIQAALKGTDASQIKMWGITNTDRKCISYLFDMHSSEMLSIITGNKKGLPDIKSNENGILGNIYDYGVSREFILELQKQ